MKRSSLWGAALCAAALVLACRSSVHAASCPVTLDWFWISATAVSGEDVQYAAQISMSTPGQYAIGLSVVGAPGDGKHVIATPAVGPRAGLVTFAWPKASLIALKIDSATAADGTKVECADSAPVVLLNSKDDVRRTFDGSSATWPDTVTATSVPITNITDPRVVRSVAPEYSAADKQAGHSGDVTVEISIGPDGHAVAVKVYKSSGFPTLDDAALNAARQSLYEPGAVNGVPRVSELLQDYVFKPQ
ncbi:MAG: energy transducer TonB [Candidatus Eremiobacteraeota bacterium]|nr:energy transducer TonB [Candidatus Eremiobacteraeota bacterium]